MGKLDDAWARYVEAKGIVWDQPSYLIDARELKDLTGQEPRLLAKHDTPDQLPKIMQAAGYTLVPTRNGTYLMLRGSMFVPLPDCPSSGVFAPKLPFPLETAGRGSSESQYIDHAYNTGLLGSFLHLDRMYLTIRGREYTKRFSYVLSGVAVDVESVQIEVDAGYEARADIVLLEAKIGVPTLFNVRQLYYPYRHFGVIVPRKRVRCVFFGYDAPTSTYSLYEFAFGNQSDPQSARVIQCGKYRLSEHARLSIYTLLNAHYQVRPPLVPQANDLNKILELLIAIEADFNNAADVAEYFGFDIRQSSYYSEAAEYLGLVTRLGGEYALTDLGMFVLSQPPEGQSQALAIAVVNSWIIVDLIAVAESKGFFSVADVDERIASVRHGGAQRYTGATIGRRRDGIITWLRGW